MTPRSFLIILIKLMGIYLAFEAIIVVPSAISTLISFRFGDDFSGVAAGITLVIVFWILAMYYLLIRYCIIKTDWIIDKLSLDKHFSEEKFELNIHRSTILTIVVIVTGGIMFVDSLPLLCKSVYNYIGHKQGPEIMGQSIATGWMIFYFVKMFVGYFLMTSSRPIVNFIERQRKK